jgi:hypothetical protein
MFSPDLPPILKMQSRNLLGELANQQQIQLQRGTEK